MLHLQTRKMHYFFFNESCFILPIFIGFRPTMIDQNDHLFQIVFLPYIKESIKLFIWAFLIV